MYQILFIRDWFQPTLGFYKWKYTEFRDTYSLHYERNSFCNICVTISIVLNTLKLVRIKHLITAGVFPMTGWSIEITAYNNHRNIIETTEP